MFSPIYLALDAPEPWLLGYQDSGSPVHEGISDLHDIIFFYLIVIGFGVGWVLFSVIINFGVTSSPISHKYITHGTLIELIWTISPALVLVAIAFPSFKLLYLADEVINPSITIRVTGHQWYWSTEYSDYLSADGDSVEFDSYIVPESDLEDGQLRLLEVDNRVVLPVDTHVRVVVSSTDVLHDLALPSLGIKIDATPGRLNQVSLFAQRPSVYYGQCSELCGTYHGFMPFVVEAVDVDEYLVWLDSQL